MAATSHSHVDQMTVIELRSLLREHKLPTSGLKADLIERVRTYQLGPATLQRRKVTPIQPSQRPSPISPPSQRPSPIPPPPQRPSPIPPPPQRSSPIPPPPQRSSPIPPPPPRPGDSGGDLQTKVQILAPRKKSLLLYVQNNFPGIKAPQHERDLMDLRINIAQLTPSQTADVEYIKKMIQEERLLLLNWTSADFERIKGLWVLPDGEIALHL